MLSGEALRGGIGDQGELPGCSMSSLDFSHEDYSTRPMIQRYQFRTLGFDRGEPLLSRGGQRKGGKPPSNPRQ